MNLHHEFTLKMKDLFLTILTPVPRIYMFINYLIFYTVNINVNIYGIEVYFKDLIATIYR